MSDHLLTKFLHLSQEITHAERLLAVDADMKVVDRIDLSDEELDSPEFTKIAEPNLKQAFAKGEVIVTNNLIADEVQAPNTNTNFSELRIVVLFPVANVGAIYMDKRIRSGMIARESVDKLAALATRIVDGGQEDSSEEQMLGWFRNL